MSKTFEPVVIKKKSEPDTDKEENQQEESKPANPGTRQKLEMTEMFLRARFDIRYNDLEHKPEYKDYNEDIRNWQPMTEYALNSIVREMRKDGISCSKTYLAEIIESNFSKRVNPIKQYFDNLDSWDRSDAIGKLADTIKTDAGPKFRNYFEKYIVGVLANVYEEEKCANHLCLVLSGEQGLGKSSWISGLVPLALRQKYYYEGRFDPENKDYLFKTASNLIVNIDDYFDDINRNKANAFKGMVTIPKVTARRPYSRYEETLPKICSFAATCNEDRFLYDSSGSRRFLAFSVEHIDFEKLNRIRIDDVWAQAKYLYESKWQYWLTKEEEKEIMERNTMFEVKTEEYELIMKYVRPAADGKPSEEVTATEIKVYLESKTRDRLSLKKIGESLRSLGFEKAQVRDGAKRTWKYKVQLLNPSFPHHDEEDENDLFSDGKDNEEPKDALPF